MTLAIASPVPPAGIAGPSDDRVPQILAELASADEACPLVEDFAGQLGRGVDDVWADLVAAEQGGWVDTWADDPRGPSATLSPLSASRLGLVLASDGSCWLRRGQPDPTAHEAPSCNVESDYATGTGWNLFDDLVDLQAVQGLDSLLLLERAARLAADYEANPPQPGRPARKNSAWAPTDRMVDESRLPRLSLLLGLSPIWPVRMTPHGPCPGCGSMPMGFTAVCLICLRSGIDHLLPVAVPLPPGPGPEEGSEPKQIAKKTKGR